MLCAALLGIHILFNIHRPWNTIAFCDWKLIYTEFMGIVFINESLTNLTVYSTRRKSPASHERNLSENRYHIGLCLNFRIFELLNIPWRLFSEFTGSIITPKIFEITRVFLVSNSFGTEKQFLKSFRKIFEFPRVFDSAPPLQFGVVNKLLLGIPAFRTYEQCI